MKGIKKLTTLLLAFSLILGTMGIGHAAVSQDAIAAAAERMQSLSLVQGREDGLALEAPITRAELITLIVRSYGLEETSQLLNGSAAFSDTRDHWASGYIAMAKNVANRNGFTLGYPDGTFRPDQNVTLAEVLAFLMKFLGVQPAEGFPWPINVIQGAQDAGLIPEGLDVVADPANRGTVFFLMDYIFYNYNLPDGRTVYTTYIDSEPPVVAVDELELTTTEPSITVTGTVTGAEVTHVLNGDDMVTAVMADGKFEAEVELELGANEILIHAVDRVGNEGTAGVTITRTIGPVASIEAPELTVSAGESVEVEAVVRDASGAEIPDAEISGTSDVGTYADGTFTAQIEVGIGTLTLTSGEATATVGVTVVPGELDRIVTDKESAEPNQRVNLSAADAHGNPIDGVTFSVDSTDAVVDSDRGIFVGFEPGVYTLIAEKDGKTVTGTIGVHGAAAGLAVEAPESMTGNDETTYTITVKAVDEHGNVVTTFDVDNGDSVTLNPPLDVVESEGPVDGVTTFVVTASSGLAESEIDVTATATIAGEEYAETVAVQVLPQVASALQVEFSGDYLPVNMADYAPGTVKVLDQEGVVMKTGEAWEVTLTIEGDGYLSEDGKTEITTSATGLDGTPFSVYPIDEATLGEATVRATAPEFAAGEDTVQVVWAFDPAALRLTPVSEEPARAAGEESYILKLEVLDKNGVPVPVTDEDGLLVLLDFDTEEFRYSLGLYEYSWAYLLTQFMVFSSPDLEEVEGANLKAILDGEMYAEVYNVVNEEGQVVVWVPGGADAIYISVISANVTGTVPVTAQNITLEEIYMGAEQYVHTPGDMAPASSSVSFVPGTISFAVFEPDPYELIARHDPFNFVDDLDAFMSAPTTLLANTDTPMTVQLKDSFWNDVTESGVKVRFRVDEAFQDEVQFNGEPGPYETVTNDMGQATVDVKALGYNESYSLQVEYYDADTDTWVLLMEEELAVRPGIAESIRVQTFGVSGTPEEPEYHRKTQFRAGETIVLRVWVSDTNGMPMSAGDTVETSYDPEETLFISGLEFGTVEFDWSLGDFRYIPGDVQQESVAWALNDNGTPDDLTDDFYEASLTAARAGSKQITVWDITRPDGVKGSASFSITPGDPAHLDIKEEPVLESGVARPFTVQITDLYGNPVPVNRVTSPVTFTVDFEGLVEGDEDGEYAQVRSSETGGMQTTFTIGATRNATTIYLISNDPEGAQLDFTDITSDTLTLQPPLYSIFVRVGGQAESLFDWWFYYIDAGLSEE